MSIIRTTSPAVIASPTSMDGRQAGAGAVNADRGVLMRQYDELRVQLVGLHCAVEPDMVAIDEAIDRLARLQSDVKATYGLIGNNPVEN